jgi:hypothetical protein
MLLVTLPVDNATTSSPKVSGTGFAGVALIEISGQCFAPRSTWTEAAMVSLEQAVLSRWCLIVGTEMCSSAHRSRETPALEKL